MKKRLAILSLVFAAAAATLPLTAMSSARAVKAEVPFAFTAGKHQLPAGTYRIERTGSHHLQIRDGDRQVRATLLALPGETASGADARLVFNKYGDERFLARVEGPGFGTTEVRQSSAEARAAAAARDGNRYRVDVDADVEP